MCFAGAAGQQSSRRHGGPRRVSRRRWQWRHCARIRTPPAIAARHQPHPNPAGQWKRKVREGPAGPSREPVRRAEHAREGDPVAVREDRAAGDGPEFLEAALERQAGRPHRATVCAIASSEAQPPRLALVGSPRHAFRSRFSPGRAPVSCPPHRRHPTQTSPGTALAQPCPSAKLKLLPIGSRAELRNTP